MNYTLFFFLCSSAILILSIIAICVAPIINGFIDEKNWRFENCEKYLDEYNYKKEQYSNPSDENKKELKQRKEKINFCKRKKAMYGLEYCSLIFDIFLGGICTILSLLHFLEIGKQMEKKTGLIGIITGAWIYFNFYLYWI